MVLGLATASHLIINRRNSPDPQGLKPASLLARGGGRSLRSNLRHTPACVPSLRLQTSNGSLYIPSVLTSPSTPAKESANCLFVGPVLRNVIEREIKKWDNNSSVSSQR
jgi:hypothetical protein